MQIIYKDGHCLKNDLSIVLNGKTMYKYLENFIKDYDEDSDKGHILEVVVEYPKKLYDSHSDPLFLPKKNEN